MPLPHALLHTLCIESSAEVVAANSGEPAIKPEEQGRGKTAEEVEVREGGGGSSAGGVSVRVEAVVESLELLLCSQVGEVAEINIRGQS